MKYRKLDENGDYSFGKGAQDFIYDTDAIAQAIRTNLQLLKGEWWEDVNEGLPMFQSILGQSGSQESIDAVDLLIKDRILNTYGVSKIVNFARSYDNRQYAITSCDVLTKQGQTVSIKGVTF